MEETAKERMQRRERGEVPARFGGTRQQGVRNTMSQVAPTGTAPTGMGSLKRTYDPLDRMPVKGADAEARERERELGYDRDRDRSYARRDEPSGRRDGDRAREERMKAMDKPQAVPTAAP
jgi:ubiquitin-like protein 5